MAQPDVPLRAVTTLFLERQHLARPGARRLTARRLAHFVEDVGGIQMDSINVLDRAHYLTVWSRFGPYDRAWLDRVVYRRRLLFEYWAHAACLVPTTMLPWWRRAMLDYRVRHTGWSGWLRRNPKLLSRVKAAVAARGPMGGADFDSRRPSGRGGWWSWKPVQHALHYLWMTGALTIHSRRHFHKRYELLERAIPATLSGSTVTGEEFARWHVERSLHAMGAATERDLAGYLTFPRFGPGKRRAALRAMIERGEVTEIEVEGQPGPWLTLTRDLPALTRTRRTVAPSRGTTLLSPFDSLLWCRARVRRLFDFDYRIEVYTPDDERVHGYYTLPILHHGRLIGRVDAKAHRADRRLEVRHVHFEPWFAGGTGPPAGGGGIDHDETLDGVAAALGSLATFVSGDELVLRRVTPRRLRAPLAGALARLPRLDLPSPTRHPASRRRESPPNREDQAMASRPQSRRTVLKGALVMTAAASVGSGAPPRRAAAQEGARQERARIDALLRQGVDANDVPGVVAMAATTKGLLYEGAFGTRDLAKGPAMTLDTVFRMASMTKAVTCVAAMQLVEQGKVKLDEPVPDIDPAVGAPQVLEGFDAAGTPRLRPAKRPITLRHLLTHTAGFSYEIWNANTQRYVKTTGMPSFATLKVASLRMPLAFDPGDKWEYGVNIDWVGRIVETISGQSLDAYFRDRIFGPLDMKDTGYVTSAEQRSRQASVHQRQVDGTLAPQPLETPFTPEFWPGGSGLYSTGRDYLAFLEMLLHEGSFKGARLLRPETVAQMARNHIGDLAAGVMKTVVPARSNDVDFFPGAPIRWGLGYMLNVQPGPSGRSAGTVSWGGIFNTYYWLDPARRVTGLILTQILPFADPRALKLYGQFEHGVYAALKTV